MKTRKPTYPEETWGSKTARQNRQAANTLTEAQREALLREAMDVINGGKPREHGKAHRPGH